MAATQGKKKNKVKCTAARQRFSELQFAVILLLFNSVQLAKRYMNLHKFTKIAKRESLVYRKKLT